MPARLLFLATIAAIAAFGQSVVSVRSGLIHFSEGEVFLSNLPVEQKAGKFPEVREGMELRTEAGRAEVLLTPGVVMRVAPDSAVEMVSASLIDTRVQFRRGSVMVEVSEEPDGTMVRMLYRDYQIRFPKKGTYRIDSMPREFRVYTGGVDIAYLGEKCALSAGQKISMYGGLEAETLKRAITDGLDEWSMRRDNQLAAENPTPGDLDGSGYDPTFSLSPNAFYGLPAYTPPVTISPYGYGYYAPGYTSPLSAFGAYGVYGAMPYPIYLYGGVGRTVIYNPPPVRMPVGRPVFGFPRGLPAPVAGRPITVVGRPVVGRAK